MMMSIRSLTKGAVSWLLVAIIIVPFALWGISSYLENDHYSALWVNGKSIDYEDYRQAFENLRRAYTHQAQGNLPPGFFSEPSFQEELIHQLSLNEVMRQYLKNEGYVTSDQELARYVREIPSFSRDGAFNSQLYHEVLSHNRLTAKIFEDRVRDDLVSQQFSNMLSHLVYVDEKEIDDLIDLAQQRRKVEYVTLNLDQYDKDIVVDEEQISTYFKDNKEDYRITAKAQVDYVEISAEILRENIIVDETLLLKAYNDRSAVYVTPERRYISHILLEVSDSSEQQEKLDEINQLRARIDAGEDFKTLASEHSDDFGSRGEGGYLGEVFEEQYEPVLMAAIRVLELGEVSTAIRSSFGYHLVRLDDYTDSVRTPIADVEDELRERLEIELSSKEYLDNIDDFKELAFQSGDSLEPFAEDFGLRVVSGKWVEEGQSGLGGLSDSRLQSEIFGEQNTATNAVSDAFELSRSHYIVYMVRERQESKLPKLGDIKDQLEEDVRSYEAKKIAQADLEQWTLDLQSGTTSFDELIKKPQFGSSQKQSFEALRNPRDLPSTQAEISRRVFQVSEQEKLPYYNWYESDHPSDQYVLYAFFEILKESNSAESQELLKVSMESLLHNRFGTAFVDDLMSYLLTSARVRRNELLLSEIDHGY